MGYSEDWAKAKTEFETKTGLKKPTAKGSLLLVSWRKSSGIEDALADVDKIMDGIDGKPLAERKKQLDKWDSLNTTLRNKATAYLGVLEDAIKKEKEAAGKTDQYRQQKILKTSLELLVSKAEQQHKMKLEMVAVHEKNGNKAFDAVEQILVSLNQIGHNVQVGLAQATKFCKEVMADPTPKTWNGSIGTDSGARRLSQALSNVCKFVYADHVDLLLKGNSKMIAILDDERMTDKIGQLNIVLGTVQKDVLRLGNVSGSSAKDGSIGFLGNNAGARLPDTASKQDVIDAVKNLAGQIKKASEIAAQLKRFGF